MNSNKDYKKLYMKYKLKYLNFKKKLNINGNCKLNLSEEFNQIGGTYMKYNDKYFNIEEEIPVLPKATDVTDVDAFDPTCITKPVITIPNNGMLEPTNKYFLPDNSEEARKYSNKCMFICIYQFLKLTEPFASVKKDFDELRGLLSSNLRDKYYKQYEEWNERDDKDKEALKRISNLLKLDIRIWESKEKFLGITDKKLDTTLATAKIGDETRKEHPEIKVLIQPIAPVFRYGAGQEHVVNILYYPGHFELIVGGSIFGEVNEDSLTRWDQLDMTLEQLGGKLDNDSSSATSNTSSENYKYEIESTENLNDYINQFNELINTKKKL